MSAQTKIAAEASVREAEATVKLADEARRYRELGWRRIVTYEDTGGGGQWRDVTFRNVGLGPALNCIFVVYFGDEYWALKCGFFLRPGEDVRTNVWRTTGTPEGFPLGFFDPVGGRGDEWPYAGGPRGASPDSVRAASVESSEDLERQRGS